VTSLAGLVIHLVGHVDDLADVYASARVVIVPLRFGSGVKLKAVEALLHGVTMVATTCGAEGIDLLSQPAIDVADEPEEFAERLASLLEEPAVWEERRATIRDLVERWGSTPARPWRSVIDEVLHA
jgi:glycosyltransferase involved in cell wall biosynthesis